MFMSKKTSSRSLNLAQELTWVFCKQDEYGKDYSVKDFDSFH